MLLIVLTQRAVEMTEKVKRKLTELDLKCLQGSQAELSQEEARKPN